jgi:hypothetical protein
VEVEAMRPDADAVIAEDVAGENFVAGVVVVFIAVKHHLD